MSLNEIKLFARDISEKSDIQKCSVAYPSADVAVAFLRSVITIVSTDGRIFSYGTFKVQPVKVWKDKSNFQYPLAYYKLPGKMKLLPAGVSKFSPKKWPKIIENSCLLRNVG